MLSEYFKIIYKCESGSSLKLLWQTFTPKIHVSVCSQVSSHQRTESTLFVGVKIKTTKTAHWTNFADGLWELETKQTRHFLRLYFFYSFFLFWRVFFLRWTLIGQSCYIYEIYILYLIFEYIAYCHEDWVFDRIFKRKIIHMFLLCFEIKFHILSIQQKLRKIFFIWHFKLNNMPAFYLTNWGSEGQHLVWVVRNLQVDIGHILLQLHTV